MDRGNLIKYEGGLVKHIGNTISITNKLLSIWNIKIVHFDDHKIFTDGVGNWVRRKMSNISIISINDYYVALDCIKNLFDNNEKIDLLITDFNHPGPNGYEFAKAIRVIEKEYRIITPILLLTFVSGDEPIVLQGIEEGVFNKYLSKEAEGDEIVDIIKAII